MFPTTMMAFHYCYSSRPAAAAILCILAVAILNTIAVKTIPSYLYAITRGCHAVL